MNLNLDNISFIRMESSFKIENFDCNDKDLNDYFYNDALKYYESLLAVTYILKDPERIVAFFSVLNDKISLEDAPSSSFWKKHIKYKLPEGKRYNSYPAVKIGRLGVNKAYQGQGYGTVILDFVKKLFISQNRTGCKYITVDAYKNDKTLTFYQKNGFNYLNNVNPKSDNTRLMYYDLSLIKNSLKID